MLRVISSRLVSSTPALLHRAAAVTPHCALLHRTLPVRTASSSAKSDLSALDAYSQAVVGVVEDIGDAVVAIKVGQTAIRTCTPRCVPQW